MVEVINTPTTITQPSVDSKFRSISTYNTNSYDQYNSQGCNDVSIQIRLFDNIIF